MLAFVSLEMTYSNFNRKCLLTNPTTTTPTKATSIKM